MSNGLKRSGFSSKPSKPMNRSYMRAKPKQGRKALIAQADGLIQAVSIALAGGICQFPGCKQEATDGHHVIHRRNYALRWRPANVPALCHMHHLWDQAATMKGKLLEGLIERMGGHANYNALVLYGNTQQGEDPADAITRMQKVLDNLGKVD